MLGANFCQNPRPQSKDLGKINIPKKGSLMLCGCFAPGRVGVLNKTYGIMRKEHYVAFCDLSCYFDLPRNSTNS